MAMTKLLKFPGLGHVALQQWLNQEQEKYQDTSAV
jgi:hypothetical protein